MCRHVRRRHCSQSDENCGRHVNFLFLFRVWISQALMPVCCFGSCIYTNHNFVVEVLDTSLPTGFIFRFLFCFYLKSKNLFLFGRVILIMYKLYQNKYLFIASTTVATSSKDIKDVPNQHLELSSPSSPPPHGSPSASQTQVEHIRRPITFIWASLIAARPALGSAEKFERKQSIVVAGGNLNISNWLRPLLWLWMDWAVR